jgi:protein tyrosine phosphatase (PTP) superfamily phosphohydrolase (DUF442 family)
LAPAGDWRPSPESENALNRTGVRLQAPEVKQDEPMPKAPAETREPPATKPPSVKEEQKSDAPLDIPGYAIARRDVAAGQQPFPDGIKWLKAHGYRAVLHLRTPGEDDAAARRQFEGQGLRYEGLEVSARGLDRALVERFNKLVTDEALLPLFVYDKDGALNGVMWYLYYRIQAGMDDDKAREQAGRLGFKPESEEQRTLLLRAKALLEAGK